MLRTFRGKGGEEAGRTALSQECLCQKAHVKWCFLTALSKSQIIFLLNKLLRETSATFSISPLFGFCSACSSMRLANSSPYLLNRLSCLVRNWSFIFKAGPFKFPLGILHPCLSHFLQISLRDVFRVPNSSCKNPEGNSWRGNCWFVS